MLGGVSATFQDEKKAAAVLFKPQTATLGATFVVSLPSAPTETPFLATPQHVVLFDPIGVAQSV